LDDFGSGYSSLNYLRRLPISTLKVDREFVQDLPTDENGTKMLKGIQALARTIGLEMLVEGIETEAQLECLQTLGCERAQGFLLSRPVAAEVLTERLLKGRFGSLFDRLKTSPLTPATGLIFS
jgi:EAL domain-containing protein (putative c-di-GMP-specific phosphodiesterase class I)